jgi:hypothetical protein
MTVVVCSGFGVASAVRLVGDVPGLRPLGFCAVGRMRLPTESVGTFSLTLTNLVVGSSIRIEIQSTGVLVELRTAGGSSEVFSVPAYSSGNTLNDLRIKVRKGSAAPLYKPYETLAAAVIGSSSVYIAQIPD